MKGKSKIFCGLVMLVLVIGTLGLSGCIGLYEDTGHMVVTADVNAGEEDLEVRGSISPSSAEDLGWMSGGMEGLDSAQSANFDLSREMDVTNYRDFLTYDTSDSYRAHYDANIAGYDGVIGEDGDVSMTDREFSDLYESRSNELQSLSGDRHYYNGGGGRVSDSTGQRSSRVSDGHASGFDFDMNGEVFDDVDKTDLYEEEDYAVSAYSFELDSYFRTPDDSDGKFIVPAIVNDTDYEVRVENEIAGHGMWEEVNGSETTSFLTIDHGGDEGKLDDDESEDSDSWYSIFEDYGLEDSKEYGYGEEYPVELIVLTTFPKDFESDGFSSQYRLYLEGLNIQHFEVENDMGNEVFNEMASSEEKVIEGFREDISSVYGSFAGESYNIYSSVVNNVVDGLSGALGGVAAVIPSSSLDGVAELVFDDPIEEVHDQLDEIQSRVDNQDTIAKFDAIADGLYRDVGDAHLFPRDEFDDTFVEIGTGESTESVSSYARGFGGIIGGKETEDRAAIIQIRHVDGFGLELGWYDADQGEYVYFDDCFARNTRAGLSWLDDQRSEFDDSMDNILGDTLAWSYDNWDSTSAMEDDLIDDYMSDVVRTFEMERSETSLDELGEDTSVYGDFFDSGDYYTEHGDLKTFSQPLLTGLFTGSREGELEMTTFTIGGEVQWDKIQKELNEYREELYDDFDDMMDDLNETWNEKYDSKVAELNNIINELNWDIENLTAEKDHLENQTERMNNTINYLRNELQDSRGRVRGFENVTADVSSWFDEHGFDFNFDLEDGVINVHRNTYEPTIEALYGADINVDRRVFEDELLTATLDDGTEYDALMVEVELYATEGAIENATVDLWGDVPSDGDVRLRNFDVSDYSDGDGNINNRFKVPVDVESRGTGEYGFNVTVTSAPEGGEEYSVSTDIRPSTRTYVHERSFEKMMEVSTRLKERMPTVYDVLSNPNSTMDDVYVAMEQNVESWREERLNYDEGLYRFRLRIRDLEDDVYVPTEVYTGGNVRTGMVQLGTRQTHRFSLMYVRGRDYEGELEVIGPDGDIVEVVDLGEFSFDPDAQTVGEIMGVSDNKESYYHKFGW